MIWELVCSLHCETQVIRLREKRLSLQSHLAGLLETTSAAPGQAVQRVHRLLRRFGMGDAGAVCALA